MHKITPCLWFDANAEEAANFCLSAFGDSHIDSIMRYGEAGPGAPGSVLSINFRLRASPSWP